MDFDKIDQLGQSIFERFGRGAHGTRADGSGLGLAIVARYAELLGARLVLGTGPDEP